jgi:hypothetical protein
MKCEDFYEQNKTLLFWSLEDQFLAWGWFLTACLGKEKFTGADVCDCYKALDLKAPPYLSTAGGKLRLDGRLIATATNVYKLERTTREELDTKFAHGKERPATVAVIDALTNLPNQLTNLAVRTYLDEALICFKHGALRAAVVMAWNLAYDHLCHFVLADPTRWGNFNNQLPRSFPRADISAIIKRDDFGELKESQVLRVCDSAHIISADVHRIMTDKLGKRNSAAHPSGVFISQHTAEEFIIDLINNVVLKLV